jgi:hypothetical protein
LIIVNLNINIKCAKSHTIKRGDKMAEKIMKTLVINGVTYEIVDEAARNDIETLKLSTIATDTTLTQSGQAADAKAVGDALKNFDGQNEIYIGSGDMPEGYTLQIDPTGDGLFIDNTLTQSGQAADAKAVGDALANIPEIEVDSEITEDGTNPVNGAAVIDYLSSKITYGTSDMTAGTSELATGTIYLVYKEEAGVNNE